MSIKKDFSDIFIARGNALMFAGLFMYLIFAILGFASGAFRHVQNQRSVVGFCEFLEQHQKSHKGMITNTAIISYMVNGKTYSVKTSYQSSFFRSGKRVIVFYDEDNPQNSFVRAGTVIYVCMAASAIVGTILLFNGFADLLM